MASTLSTSNPALQRAVENTLRSVLALGVAVQAVDAPTTPQIARAVQATENRWRAIESEFGLLNSTDVARLLGSRASNTRSFTADQRKAGRVLGIRRGKSYLYPGFQFDANGVVQTAIPTILRLAADADWSAESTAMWLCSPSGWLADRRPVDLLATEPDAVLAAARAKFNTQW
ncbi:hypothetical protein [Tomitella biformata]|uniref:hypothetical protein n=1 Tax=Tomitella biformata TaxID=630403 RepID=UPI0004659E10|nr:hypothetical protein [Tomitella biformata]